MQEAEGASGSQGNSENGVPQIDAAELLAAVDRLMQNGEFAAQISYKHVEHWKFLKLFS